MSAEFNNLARVYDKGERRHKHVGTKAYPEIRFESGNPRHYTGLCPCTLDSGDHRDLLQEAIADSNGDRDLEFPKRLHVVHEGAVYRAETTDWGKSYHGYPYRGKLGRGLLEKLREMATAKECLKSFEDWVDQHIELHGK